MSLLSSDFKTEPKAVKLPNLMFLWFSVSSGAEISWVSFGLAVKLQTVAIFIGLGN